MKKTFWTTRNIAGCAILGAMSILLYLFVKFKLPFIFPSFLDFQFSEVPALIAGYAYGPIGGIIVIILRFIGKIAFMGSQTAYVGEVADLIIGLALVIPSAIIYKRHHNIKGAVASFVISALLSTIVALIANAFVLIPFYLKLYFNNDVEALVRVLSIIPGINSSNYLLYYIFYACLPFNLLRYLAVGILTFALYKRIKWLLDKIGHQKKKENENNQ